MTETVGYIAFDACVTKTAGAQHSLQGLQCTSYCAYTFLQL